MNPNKKILANKRVKRNKKPLRNYVYKVELSKLKEGVIPENYRQYLFKEMGYVVLYWKYQGGDASFNFHGFITPENLRRHIGDEQYRKFCGEGKREFIVQRRFDGKNI